MREILSHFVALHNRVVRVQMEISPLNSVPTFEKLSKMSQAAIAVGIGLRVVPVQGLKAFLDRGRRGDQQGQRGEKENAVSSHRNRSLTAHQAFKGRNPQATR